MVIKKLTQKNCATFSPISRISLWKVSKSGVTEPKNEIAKKKFKIDTMTTVSTFLTDKELTSDLLRDVATGKIQLPDFQRGWVWDDEHIKSLLASLTLAYPIGAVMLLEAGSEEVKFKTRAVEGVKLSTEIKPEKLILDGQQRLTSLFQVFSSKNHVQTRDIKGATIYRWYYLDIKKAINPNIDREDAIISLPEDKKIKNFRGEVIADYSTLEKECEAEYLPFSIIFDTPKLTDWQMKYLQSDQSKIVERLNIWNTLNQKIIQCIQQYHIPFIQLKKDTPKEAVCQVFEKVNTGGVSLTVFELLTATYAADDYNLRDDWNNRKIRFSKIPILQSVENTDFLQSLTLLSTYYKNNKNSEIPISCKRKDILKLPLEEYVKYADAVSESYEKVARFLHTQKFFSSRELPYRTQLTPLAAMFAVLGETAENDGVKQKIAKWFWCGILGELYGGAIESRFAKDLPDVIGWITNGAEPATVTDANFSKNRLLTLKTRNSAAYKGIYVLLMRDGCLDFRNGDSIDIHSYFDEKIDIHHIFPRAYCISHGLDEKKRESIVNKTPISARTNRIIGGNAPRTYLEKLQNNPYAPINDDRMTEILKSHSIDIATLKENDFDNFYENRSAELIKKIEKAMGKIITTSVSAEIYQEEPDEITEEII